MVPASTAMTSSSPTQFAAILGGLTPLIATSLLALGGGRPWLVAAFTAAVAALSWVCVLFIGDHRAHRTEGPRTPGRPAPPEGTPPPHRTPI
ncbi:hypothetical protein GCM10027091_66250 [Streptomyces daliensis]